MLKLNKNTSARIIDEQYSLARAIVGRQLDLPSPRQKSSYHERRAEFLESAMYCLSHLSTAVAVSRPSLFADYVGWSKVTWLQRSIPLSELRKHLQCTQDVIGEALPAALARPACLYVAEALRRLPGFPQKMPAVISQQSPLGELARRYLDTLLRGDRLAATTLIIEVVNQGTNIQDIYLNVFERCQYEIGRLWQMTKLV